MRNFYVIKCEWYRDVDSDRISHRFMSLHFFINTDIFVFTQNLTEAVNYEIKSSEFLNIWIWPTKKIKNKKTKKTNWLKSGKSQSAFSADRYVIRAEMNVKQWKIETMKKF